MGGFDSGLDDAGMRCVWQCEKDADCLKTLRKHWPDVPKITDVKDVKHAGAIVRPDLICGGSPCQGFSVAGRGEGLDDERSSLFFEFARIVFEQRPRWVLFENVPGLFSSNAGNDFAAVLEAFTGRRFEVPEGGWRNSGAAVGPLYNVTWRTLDAQYFGVAQRRRRVFLVGRLGDGSRRSLPLEVLFESESMFRDSPPSRKTGAGAAGAVAACLNNGGNAGGFRTEPGEHIVVHTLTSGGHDASEDGTGRGGEFRWVVQAFGGGNRNELSTASCLTTNTRLDFDMETFVLGAPIPFDTTQITSADNESNPQPGALCHTLSSQGHAPAVAFNWQSGGEAWLGLSEITYPLTCFQTQATFRADSSIRRLTPIECLRLQGFPDDWFDGTGLSDSAKYRLCGNAVCRNVARWIGRRIMSIE